MKRLKSIQFVSKLFSLLSILLLAIISLLFLNISTLDSSFEMLSTQSVIYYDYLKLVDSVRTAQVTFKIQVQEWKDILLRGNNEKDFDKYYENFKREKENVLSLLDSVIVMKKELHIDTNDVTALKAEIISLDEKYKQALQSFDATNPEAGKIVDRLVRGVDRRPTELMDTLVASVLESAKAQSQLQLEEREKANDKATTLMTIISCCLILFCLWISWAVFREFSRASSALLSYTRAVARGEYDVEIGYSSGNEFGELAKALILMVDTLKEKLGFNNGIMKAITTPCIISDTNCNIIYVNQAIIDLIDIGGHPEQYKGKNAAEFFYNDKNKSTITEKVCRTNSIFSNVMANVVTRKGKSLYCNVNAAPVIDLNGDIMAGLALVTNITEVVHERKHAENQAEEISRIANNADSISRTIAEASTNLAQQVEQASDSASVQQTRIGEASTAMQHMSARIIDVARSADQAVETVANAKEKAASGAKIVGDVIQGINDIHRESITLKEDMGGLGKQAEAIGQVMNVISDIADQTNLLALNAAIEAARAGEAGRGFAVVADEVRKLAEKTMSATKEVGDAIQGIQQGAKKNIESVDRSVVKIDDVNNLSSFSGDSLREIVALIDETTNQVQAIASAADEQSTVSEEIRHSLEDVSSLCAETAEAMQNSTHDVDALARQAQELNLLIETMQQTEPRETVRALEK